MTSSEKTERLRVLAKLLKEVHDNRIVKAIYEEIKILLKPINAQKD